MKVKDYQKEAMVTLMPTCDNYVYASTGLVEEVGELNEKISYCLENQIFSIQDNCIAINIFAEDDVEMMLDGIKLELGDIAWFIALTARVFGYTFDYLFEGLDYGKKCKTITALMNMHTIIGETSGTIAKSVRKNLINVNYNQCVYTNATDVQASVINEKILNCLKLLAENYVLLINSFNFDIEDVLQKNIEKLRSRLKRNVIDGNGDYR